jgi:hypothetical protein
VPLPADDASVGKEESGAGDDRIISQTASFVVKIFVEMETSHEKLVHWRGHITHVPSGDRRYVGNLQGISLFIFQYLQSMGVRFSFQDRLKYRANRTKIVQHEPTPHD